MRVRGLEKLGVVLVSGGSEAAAAAAAAAWRRVTWRFLLYWVELPLYEVCRE